MSKSILVLTTPVSCADCALMELCQKQGLVQDLRVKSSHCPLVKLPQERQIPENLKDDWDWGYMDGFNNLLAYLLQEDVHGESHFS